MYNCSTDASPITLRHIIGSTYIVLNCVGGADSEDKSANHNKRASGQEICQETRSNPNLFILQSQFHETEAGQNKYEYHRESTEDFNDIGDVWNGDRQQEAQAEPNNCHKGAKQQFSLHQHIGRELEDVSNDGQKSRSTTKMKNRISGVNFHRQKDNSDNHIDGSVIRLKDVARNMWSERQVTANCNWRIARHAGEHSHGDTLHEVDQVSFLQASIHWYDTDVALITEAYGRNYNKNIGPMRRLRPNWTRINWPLSEILHNNQNRNIDDAENAYHGCVSEKVDALRKAEGKDKKDGRDGKDEVAVHKPLFAKVRVFCDEIKEAVPLVSNDDEESNWRSETVDSNAQRTQALTPSTTHALHDVLEGVCWALIRAIGENEEREECKNEHHSLHAQSDDHATRPVIRLWESQQASAKRGVDDDEGGEEPRGALWDAPGKNLDVHGVAGGVEEGSLSRAAVHGFKVVIHRHCSCKEKPLFSLSAHFADFIGEIYWMNM